LAKIIDSQLAEKGALSSSQVDTPKWGFMQLPSQIVDFKLTQLDTPKTGNLSTSRKMEKEEIQEIRKALAASKETPQDARAISTPDGIVVIKQTNEYTDVEIK
jgi:hypothetical protein